jgi:hypothetical protein
LRAILHEGVGLAFGDDRFLLVSLLAPELVINAGLDRLLTVQMGKGALQVGQGICLEETPDKKKGEQSNGHGNSKNVINQGYRPGPKNQQE